MSQLELTPSLPAAIRPQQVPLKSLSTAPPTSGREYPVRDIVRLMADIRRARALLEAATAFEQAVPAMELVASCDPRD